MTDYKGIKIQTFNKEEAKQVRVLETVHFRVLFTILKPIV